MDIFRDLYPNNGANILLDAELPGQDSVDDDTFLSNLNRINADRLAVDRTSEQLHRYVPPVPPARHVPQSRSQPQTQRTFAYRPPRSWGP